MTTECAHTKQGLRSLKGRRVLVTGSGRGIGQAMAVICSQEGARVALTSRTVSELEETAGKLVNYNNDDDNDNDGNNSIDPSPLILQADLTKQDEIDSMVESIVESWGGLDILINNAGGAQTNKGPSEALSSEDLMELLNLNVVSVHRVTKAVLNKAMMKGGDNEGQIINVSSRAGKIGIPNYSFYVSTKFALEGLTASLAAELRDRNIRVNSISPGMVNTRTFPKPADREGVRSAESIRDGLLVLLNSNATGKYLHVDELDVVRQRGLPDAMALKTINEPKFDPSSTIS